MSACSVGGGRGVERSLPLGADERQRVADRADHLGVLGHDDLEAHRARNRPSERARAAADGDEGGGLEVVFADDGLDELADRLHGRLQRATGDLVAGQVQRLARDARTRRAPASASP